MQLKKPEALRILEKLRFVVRSGKERFARFYFNEVLITTTAVPHGKGDMYVSNQFRQQLKLSQHQLLDAKRCPFGYEDYVEHLRDIGAIRDEHP